MSTTFSSTILLQHFEDCSFLWILRDYAIRAPHYTLNDLAKLDYRIEAHIDGLSIAGDAGWESCRTEQDWNESGEIFTASVLSLESQHVERIKSVFQIGIKSIELCRGIISALGWLPYIRVADYISELLASESPVIRRIGIAAAANHRRDPGPALERALDDPDLPLRAHALMAVGQVGRTDLKQYLLRDLAAEYTMCRFSAAWSAALFGEKSAVAVLAALATANFPHREEATRQAVRRMGLPEAHDWVNSLAGSGDTVRLAMIGAGALGDPALIPWVISFMSVPSLARVAGEVFTTITGADLALLDLEGKRPEGFESGPTESPEDENVEMDPDEHLPWPDPALVSSWWARNKGEFRNGTRYLLGRPISAAHLEHVLRIGRQRQRAAAAIELAMLNPGQPLFEVRAPGFRQQEMLGIR